MELSKRISFVEIIEKIDKDGYNVGTEENILYTCWARINKYFSKVQFDSMNLDITKTLNITCRYCKIVKELLDSGINLRNIFIKFDNKLYKITAPDFSKYSMEFVQVIGVLNE